MKVVASFLFYVIRFPHRGKVLTIDQLDYYTLDLGANANTNVPFFRDSPRGYATVGADLFKDSSLFGTFTHPPPDNTHVVVVNMISSIGQSSRGYDPWVILELFDVESYGDTMLLSSALAYAMI